MKSTQQELPKWKVGDWVVLDMDIGQITEIRDDGGETVSTGWITTSGMLQDRFRPLTLRNKRIVEHFHHYYMKLHEIDGEAGFNYPDISRHFTKLALQAIDNEDDKEPYEQAPKFVNEAKEYKTEIQGVYLFRHKVRGGII